MEKSADFAGFSRGKQVEIRKKIGRFRWGLPAKSQISKDFQGQIAEKSADFTGNFGGKLRQETINKKQPISLDFFLANFTKIDQFCVDMTSVV